MVWYLCKIEKEIDDEKVIVRRDKDVFYQATCTCWSNCLCPCFGNRGGALLAQPTKTETVEASKTKQTTTSTTTSQSSVDKEAELVKAAEAAVKKLEQDQVNENVQPAQDAVTALKTGATKDKLQKRIDLVKLNMAHVAEQARLLAESERLVKQLEDNQVNEHVQPAQDTVDRLANADQKAGLQHRIDLVKQAIAAREAEAAAQAQAAQTAAAGQVAQGSGYTNPQGPYQAPVQTGNGTSQYPDVDTAAAAAVTGAAVRHQGFVGYSGNPDDYDGLGSWE